MNERVYMNNLPLIQQELKHFGNITPHLEGKYESTDKFKLLFTLVGRTLKVLL